MSFIDKKSNGLNTIAVLIKRLGGEVTLTQDEFDAIANCTLNETLNRLNNTLTLTVSDAPADS